MDVFKRKRMENDETIVEKPEEKNLKLMHPLETLKMCIETALHQSGVDLYYIQNFKSQECISYLHNKKQAYYMPKKKWMEEFGGNIPHKYPPWLPTTHCSVFYESLFNYYNEKLYKNIEKKSRDILHTFLTEKNEKVLQLDENEHLVTCFHNPLPLLIFSPQIHTYHFEEQKQSVRFYSNILNKKWKKENMEERFLKIQEMNHCITFCCIKNTLKAQEKKFNNDESPILHMNLHPTHICLLACIFFTNTVQISGSAIDVPYYNLFLPEMLLGILKGCRYVFLSGDTLEQINQQESIRKFCFENEIRKQGFLQGKRRFLSFMDQLKFLKEIPDLNVVKWERINLKTDQIETFSVNSSFFMFAQKSKQEGEFLCAQLLYELNKETQIKNIKVTLPGSNDFVELSEREAMRLEMYHTKSTCQHYIPSLQTKSKLDGSSDFFFQCPTLLQNIKGNKFIL